MKSKYIIGILALLLVMAGTASAEENQTIILTEDNSSVNMVNAGTLPDGIINVKVTYNPTTGKLTYTDSSPDGPENGGPYLENPRIQAVAYNLPRNGIVTPGSWAQRIFLPMGDFGFFERQYVNYFSTYRKIDVQLSGGSPYPTFSESGNVVAVLLKFDRAYDENGNEISCPYSNNCWSVPLMCTYLAGGVTTVPEFPTIALPVAAMIGLIFIFGRRREE